MDELVIAKDIYTLAKPLVDPLIQTMIRPKLERLKQWFQEEGVKNDLIDHGFHNKFEEYLIRTFERCHYINTIVFPNQQVKLDDVYLHAHLINPIERFFGSVESIDNDFFQNFQKILIQDQAGMGKSTFSKFLCKHIILNKLGIPVLIELRKLDSNHLIIAELFRQLNPIDKSFKEEFILKLLARGDFIFILDGFDEIPLETQGLIIDDLKEVMSKAAWNKFVLTSRPEGALLSFGNFHKFIFRPLSEDEAFALIKKYDSLSAVKVASRLINDIKERRAEQITDFLSNPFMVSLLYKTYSYNKDIPTKRVTFYEEVFSALFKAHDLTKDGFRRQKLSNLDIQDFRVVLRYLAFLTAKLRKVEFTEQELLSFIEQSKETSKILDFKASGYFEDLLSTVPLMVRDGQNVKWSHRSIQDYFAAEFICFHSEKEAILQKIHESENQSFFNILLFVFELDTKAFRKTILKRILTEFIEHSDRAYSLFPDIAAVKERKSVAFGTTIFFINGRFINEEQAVKIVNESFQGFPEGTLNSTRRFNSEFFILYKKSYSARLLELLSLHVDYLSVNEGAVEPTYSVQPLYGFWFEPNKPMMLNDDLQNPLNSQRDFETVTSWIKEDLAPSGRNRSHPLILDVAKCRREMQSINDEIDSDKGLDILEGI